MILKSVEFSPGGGDQTEHRKPHDRPGRYETLVQREGEGAGGGRDEGGGADAATGGATPGTLTANPRRQPAPPSRTRQTTSGVTGRCWRREGRE